MAQLETIPANERGSTKHVNTLILDPKEYLGHRVVTFKDVDFVHGRKMGTAKKRFSDNKHRFIEGTDYFMITQKSLENTEKSEKRTFNIPNVPPRGIIVLTETGYLMLVKSFTDDIAWNVQRELVNCYFRPEQNEKILEERKHDFENCKTDIPDRPEFQKAFAEIREDLAALNTLLRLVNRRVSYKDARAYIATIQNVAISILVGTCKFDKMEYGIVKK